MGLSLENTKKAKKRFKEAFGNDYFNGVIKVYQESKYGCEAIEAIIDRGITLRELQDIKEGIHNTMSVGVDDESGKLYVSIW
ncbi:hypothetical protein [Gaetbulibacter sp. PBL-D1]|uniref:hypothetical protein n=1 Tax=Gaetbulibacter sp. PBL-D1 TaxID=3422594 RepID=UPI003D2F1962